ncbi:MAG: chemotaxis protein CheC [Chloroflexi bacterium]|nr:chemotaxis protein CheC [Chloroflexota bacterium]MDA1219542.1 chemotaxis protein CheC [Chloroflexota bacterium]
MVDTQATLNDDMRACTALVSEGSANAIIGLSQMIGQEIKVTHLNARVVPVNETPDLVGGWEAVTLGIYLGVIGDATGHILLVYKPETAMALADLLMGEPPGTTKSLEEMEESALGEVGNIMGSFFLNALSDATGFSFQPSPPAVMLDMAGAILDVALSDIIQESDDALVVETGFSTDDRTIEGTLLVMPSPDLLRVLVEHIRNGN